MIMRSTASIQPPPLPMTVVTGYLGSGKTTLINKLLANANGRRITVLVNDFGEIALDAELIQNNDGDVISLANGCMCCQIGGDLYTTIDRILALRNRIDYLVVETSGVADPAKISQIAAAEPELTDNGILTLIDCANFMPVHGQVHLRDTLQRQIQKADLILLTKIPAQDHRDYSKIWETVSATAPDCPVIVDVEEAMVKIVSPRGFKTACKTGSVTNPLEIHSVPFESWNWRGESPLNRNRLVDLLLREELRIYRCKGVVKFDDGSSAVVNKVGDNVEVCLTNLLINHSILTVIGSIPGFSRAGFEAAWKDAAVMSKLAQ